MKIIFLAPTDSSHTIKWANSLSESGIQVLVYGLTKSGITEYHKNIIVEELNVPSEVISGKSGSLSKFIYCKAYPQIKHIIKTFKPQLLHANYATSYGLIGAITGFHPFVLSVWGDDVFTFPQKSIAHKMLVKYNFHKADKILSTSRCMSEEIAKYTSKKIEITPFGVDMEKFTPRNELKLFNGNEDYIVGTVKGLENQYGIEYLIEAYNLLRKRIKNKKIKLLIVGDGSLKSVILKKIEDSPYKEDILLTGKVKFTDIQKYHNVLDIYIAISISESFGVAVLEASACGKPVIVSNVGGLPEVVMNEVTGFIVPPKDPMTASLKIEELINDRELRLRMGKAGRDFVNKNYNWKNSITQMIGIYNDILGGKN
ncbi:MAG: glycosyltransferase [Ignavibacteriaceae bacterium]|nr:glycosyltransferase [Ignavibacteriaceae bacterium]